MAANFFFKTVNFRKTFGLLIYIFLKLIHVGKKRTLLSNISISWVNKYHTFAENPYVLADTILLKIARRTTGAKDNYF